MIAGLHGHNEYSLLDGAATAFQHAVAAREAGYIALAETNHGTLAGSLHHMAACSEAGIMPIVGCEVYYRPNRKVQGQKEWRYVHYHLTIHAKDLNGWKNLMALVSESHQTGFYGKPCIDDELLEKYHEGLMCLTGCVGGRLAKSILAEDDRQAESWLRQLKRIFRDDLFVEIMPHDLDMQRVANLEAISMALRHGLPIVATTDAHYPTPEWAPTQDILLMIATNQTRAKREKKREAGEDVYEFALPTFYHQTEDEIRKNFAQFHPGIPKDIVDQAITNTVLAASRTTPFLVDKSEKMPIVSYSGDESNAARLRRLCFDGLKKRGYADDPEYVADLEMELETFESRGQTNYMLLVGDIVEWSKSTRPVPKRKGGKLVFDGPEKKPIMVGPGRGSAAGSKAAWCLGVTNLNPKKYKTLFERFVNPNRKGLPDIDIDFPPDRVDEVEDYIAAIHGRDRVVDIIAHSTFGPRAALTDVGRVLNIPYDHVKSATKTIDDNERGALLDLAKINPAVNKLAQQYPDYFREACRIQGMVARKSEHAGGVLILPGPRSEYMPIERTGGMKGKMLSAWGERSGKGNALISTYNFVKIDVLRVAELTKQQHAVDLIKQRTGKDINLDDLAIHDDPMAADPKVMQGFKDGLLVGIFQFSATASKLTRQIKPDNVLELAAINALIRPGPRGAGADQRFHQRKHGHLALEYWHPSLEPFMDYTYAEMVFQEQLIEVVHHLGGLSRADADIFRKIASKLYRDPDYAKEVMGEWEVPIKASFKEKGLDEKASDIVWANMLSFSDYSFNLAHAAGYAVLAYRDMWLKTYYPREFYAAFLSKGLSQVTKKKILQKQEAARESRSLGLKIMPPDVHESGTDYTVVEGGIRLGLEAIKNIGPAASRAIIEHRPFTSYQDFERKVPGRAVNITGKGSMVMAGAFDRWHMRDDFTEERIDELERELLGMSLTSVHSIQQYAHVINEMYWTEDEVENAAEGTRVTIMGEIQGVKEHRDKNGRIMCFLDMVNGPNAWSCTVFEGDYRLFKDVINSRRPLHITGDKNTHKGRVGITVRALDYDNDDPNNQYVPPIQDLGDYVEAMGALEERAQDSIFPEDVEEALGYTTA
jgi:DNA polymerase-3 subunit alpha